MNFFKGNQTYSGLSSFFVSFLIVYGLNKLNFDYYNWFSFFIPEELLSLIVILSVLGGSVFAISKWGFEKFLIGFFILLIILGVIL